MTLTETRPETDDVTVARGPAPVTLDRLVGSADHKTIGRAWITAGLLFLIVSAVVTVIAGVEATSLDDFSIVDDADQMAQVWSLGRTLLLFGALAPIMVGLATFLVPLQVGAPALAFARGAAGAFWTWLLGTGLLVVAYLANGGPGGGRADFVVLWAAALGMVAGALVWAMVVITTTILGARTRGMTLERVPHTTWSFLVFSLVGIFTLPLIMAELVIIYVQVRHGFLPVGERLGLTGVMESLSLPPTVYWLGIPVLGMAADVIGVHTERPIPAHTALLSAIGLFGILVFGADFLAFASVRPLVYDHGLLVLAIAACVLPILAVLGLCTLSMRSGVVRLNAALVGVLAAGALLLVAAISALLALGQPVALFIDAETPASVDTSRLLILNGTTFHDGIRGLVTGSAVVAIVGALHHWSAKLWGRRLSGPLTLISVLLGAAGALVWGLGAILAGVDDQVAYPAATLVGGDNVEFFNLIAVVGMILLAIAVVVAAVNNLIGIGGQRGAAGAWSGTTLEWATASPPTFGNFEQPPVVRSATPLLDGITDDDGAGSDNGDDGTETPADEEGSQ